MPHFFYLPVAGEDGLSERDLEVEIEAGLAELGFELVELERAGRANRPVLRLRIDHRWEAGAPDEAAVTLEDCARASRALEARLEADPRFPATYVLEVSSPGVERPLVRRSDFDRFAGREVALHGKRALAGRAKTVKGELLGVREGEGEAVVALRLDDGEELEIPRSEVTRANLVFRWGSEGRRS